MTIDRKAFPSQLLEGDRIKNGDRTVTVIGVRAGLAAPRAARVLVEDAGTVCWITVDGMVEVS